MVSCNLIMNQPSNVEHAAFVKGLRDLANWYESQPELKLPTDPQLTVVVMDDPLNTFRTFAKAFGFCEKQEDDQFYRLVRNFGPVSLKIFDYRKNVCTRKIVGQRTVEQPIYDYKQTGIKTVTEDIVEWDCPVLLESPAA